MATADVVVPATTTHAAATATAETALPSSASTTSSAAIVCVAVSAACVSKLVAYYGTLAVSLVFFARAAWPDRVDAFLLRPLAAHARSAALLARADLEADLRLITDAHPAAEVVFAAAEASARVAIAAVAGLAGAARRKVVAKWSEHKDAAVAAWSSLLGLAGDGEGEEEAVGFELGDVVSLVEIGFCLLCTVRLVSRLIRVGGMPLSTACFAATCGLLVLLDDWIDPTEDDDDDANETDGAAAVDDVPDDTPSQLVDVELEVRKSWQFVRVLILVAYCADALYFHVVLGPQPVALALLALCNLGVLNVGRRVELSPDDVDGEGEAAAVDKWRRGAISVFVASSVKVFAFVVVYLMRDFYLAPPPLSLLLLGVMGDLLLDEEDYLVDLVVSGDDEDEEEEDGAAAGSSQDIAGEVQEEGADGEAKAAEHSNSNASSSEDEEEANVRSSEDEGEANASSLDAEEESRVLEEKCEISEDHFIPKDVSEDHEHPKEQISRDDEDEHDNGAAGSSEVIAGRVKEESDEAKPAEHSNGSSPEDEEEAIASSPEGEEESRALEEHCDISEDHFIQKDIPEDHEHTEEQVISRDEEDEVDNGAAGSSEEITGRVEEGSDEAKAAEHSNGSSSDDEEEANASSSEDEEESRALDGHCDVSEDHFIQKEISDDHEHPKEQQEGHCDISEDHFVHKDISEDHEHPKEQQQEEPDYSSSGSTDDSWDLVEVDPEMQGKDICEANPKPSTLFPWKQAA
ncbi:hypothetical protein HU200_031604 [Digitaria exilis]|uniref:Uncharacterized protein n=1 Tax=Digitaria exilis TaxID=1010633 RepID=A0A835BPE0_9POAL|nr:hypothetical protein HU200_031604 [Digitaria exilis]CAB3485136.1 unnamed protein product [Digitaria exilis]